MTSSYLSSNREYYEYYGLSPEKLEYAKQDALIRMPFQVLLIIIAYWHSLKNSSKNFSYICLFLFLVIIIYFAIII